MEWGRARDNLILDLRQAFPRTELSANIFRIFKWKREQPKIRAASGNCFPRSRKWHIRRTSTNDFTFCNAAKTVEVLVLLKHMYLWTSFLARNLSKPDMATAAGSMSEHGTFMNPVNFEVLLPLNVNTRLWRHPDIHIKTYQISPVNRFGIWIYIIFHFVKLNSNDYSGERNGWRSF